MQSLRDKNRTKHTRTKIAVSVGALIVIVLIVGGLSPRFGNGFRTLFSPLITLETNISENMHVWFANFAAKRALMIENDQLKQKLIEQQVSLADKEALRQENEDLKEILNRKETKNFILAVITAKPSRSLYDTLVIDAGKEQGITQGALVYAAGTVPLGVITELNAKTAIVTLFSTAGQHTNARVMGTNIDVELVGRGGGNFELKVPRDVALEPGTSVILPGIHPAVLATIVKSITDPRDPAQTFLLTSSVNINELAWVQVLK